MQIKHLTYDLDFSKEEILGLFGFAKKLKEEQKKGKPHLLLKGKSLAMLFEKPSTRTRVSFEVAMTQLGGHALHLASSELHLHRGETIADTARVLSRYVDAIMARVYAHKDIIELAENSSVPVINGLSDEFHPCQALTDFFTIFEKRGNLDNLTFAFVGDGNNNVTNSLLLLAARLGVNFNIGCPEKYKIREEILELAGKEALNSGTEINIYNEPEKAVKNSDIISTDTWLSMGRTDTEERLKILKPFQVNKKLLGLAKPNACVMHCLPAHRGEEITNEVMDGPQSIIFDQAENRLHIQKAILTKLMD